MRIHSLSPLAPLLALSLALVASPVAHAQEDDTPQARQAYGTGLAEVRKLLADHQLDAAQKKLDPLLKQRPREAQARFFKGMLENERGDTAGAARTFETLVADYPELPEPYNNLAVIYAGRGDLEAARSALETAVKTEPGFALAHENLGDLHVRIAATHYDRAAQLDRAGKTAPAKLALARELLAPHPAPAAAARP